MTVKGFKYSGSPFYYSIFAAFVALLIVAVTLFFIHEKKNIYQKKTEELKNITLFKSKQISEWYNDELNDAYEIAGNTSLIYATIANATSDNQDFNKKIAVYLQGVKAEHDYSAVFLTDSSGNVLYSSNDPGTPLNIDTKAILSQSFPGRATTSDIFRTSDGNSFISFIAPLKINAQNGPVPAFMGMRINPDLHLYPWVEQIGFNVASTEIVLFRNNNDSIQVLSALKDTRSSAAASLSHHLFSVLESKQKEDGSFEGTDYRGKKVLGYVSPVENTSWYVLTKIDKTDILLSYYHTMKLIIPMIILAIILTGLILLYINARRLNSSFQQLIAEEAKFKTTLYSIGDAVIITDRAGYIKNMNQVAEETTGWKESEVIGKPIEDVFNIINETTRKKVETPVIKIMRDGLNVSLASHILLIRRDGSELPIAVSGAPIKDETGEMSGVVVVFRDQSEEYQRKDIIEQSELSYRKMFINNPQPMLIYQTETFRILEVNDAMIEKYGYSREEFLQMKTTALRPEKEVAHYIHQMGLSSDKLFHVGEVWQHRLKNGEIIFVEISSHLITYNKQSARHVLISDISQRLHAEDALLQSEYKFRMLFENHSAKKMIVNPETLKIEDANNAACKFYGWTREEFKMMELSDINLLSREEIQEIITGIDNLPDSTYEFKHKKRDGSVFDAEVFSSKMYIDDKLMLHSIIQDISVRKKAEERVNILISSINQSPVGILIADTFARITYLNPYMIEMTGFSSRELIGKTPYLLTTASEPLYSDIQQTLKKGEEWKGELEDTKKNGEKYWKNVAISAVRNKNGEIASYVMIQEDITMRRKIMQDLIESQQKAEESDRLKSSFLANMSHEIRTPMNGILGFMDLLQDPDLTGDEREEYMGIVRSSGNRLLSTINDIIDISKIESGQVVINISQFNINNLLKRMHLFFNAEASEKGLTLLLDSECNEADAVIRSDLSKLESVYTNLIKNAIKFTDSGFIKFGCIINEGRLHGFVEDTGRGIPDNRLESVFSRFVQVDTSYSRSYEGSGLGLSITKAFVEILGGMITVQSTLNKGSRFDFSLEFTPGEVALHPYAESANIDVPEKNNGLILVAEDDEVSFLFLTKLLAGLNFKFIHAQNGEKAVEFSKINPDIKLVLMDIKMPVMDGYEATRTIKSFRPDLPIVAVTAFAFAEDRNKAMECGCDDYISKPVSRKQLLDIIGRFLKSG